MSDKELAPPGFSWIGQHLLCLIDILGQQKELSSWAVWPSAPNELSSFMAALWKSYYRVQEFRRMFLMSLRQAARTDESLNSLKASVVADHPSAGRIINCYSDIEPSFQQFSDTLLFYKPMRRPNDDINVGTIYCTLMSCCLTMIHALAEGVPLRGSLCMGLAMELDTGSVYGPVLARAHFLESNVCGYPRIIVDQQVVDFLSVPPRCSNDESADRTLKILASLCQAFVCKDDDGEWIVDFLGSAIRGLVEYHEGGAIERAVPALHTFIQKTLDQTSKLGCEKLTMRYAQLLKYVEKRIVIWQ